MYNIGSQPALKERRTRVRFPLVRGISYRSLSKKHSSVGGQGETVNISSSGALFSTEHELQRGMKVELAITWPLNLNERVSLKLVAEGTVVRAEALLAAVRFDSHEFRIVPAKPAMVLSPSIPGG